MAPFRMIKHLHPYSDQLNIRPVGKDADVLVLLVLRDERSSTDQTASEVVNA